MSEDKAVKDIRRQALMFEFAANRLSNELELAYQLAEALEREGKNAERERNAKGKFKIYRGHTFIAGDIANPDEVDEPTILAYLGYPMVVLYAFTAELYLKAIITAAGDCHGHKHELMKLFNSCLPDVRGRITSDVCVRSGINEDDFFRNLESHSNAFVLYRYHHENTALFDPNAEIQKPGSNFNTGFIQYLISAMKLELELNQ